MSEQLLLEPMGQEALSAIYRFITHNSEWVQRTLGVTASIGGGTGGGADDGEEEKPKLVPWGEKTFKEPSPKETIHKIGRKKKS